MTRNILAAAVISLCATSAGAAVVNITGDTDLTDTYTPVASGNHGLELRDGRAGARDWELGLGTNTQRARQFDQEKHFSWDDSNLNTDGGSLQWAFEFIYSGGTSEFLIWDAATQTAADAILLSYDGLTTGGNTINIFTKRGAAINIEEIDGETVDFTFGDLSPLNGYRDSHGYIYSAGFDDGFTMKGTLDMFDEGRGSKHGIRISLGNIVGTPDPMAPVPVPAALPLLAAGLGGLVFLRSRRRRG
ncbi:MAG: hypothetical protein AAGC86_07605 [Pseudomonadota bacterium]